MSDPPKSDSQVRREILGKLEPKMRRLRVSDTSNYFEVTRLGNEIRIGNFGPLRSLSGPVRTAGSLFPEQAVQLGAWLLCIADPEGSESARVLAEIRRDVT